MKTLIVVFTLLLGVNHCFARDVYCNGAPKENFMGSKLYPNGNKLRDSFKSPLYPSGRRVKDSMGKTLYPNGKRAYDSQGTFYYPNGRKAIGFMSQVYDLDGRKINSHTEEISFQFERDLWAKINLNTDGSLSPSVLFTEEFSDHKLEFKVDMKTGQISGIKCSNIINKSIGSF